MMPTIQGQEPLPACSKAPLPSLWYSTRSALKGIAFKAIHSLMAHFRMHPPFANLYADRAEPDVIGIEKMRWE